MGERICHKGNCTVRNNKEVSFKHNYPPCVLSAFGCGGTVTTNNSETIAGWDYCQSSKSTLLSRHMPLTTRIPG